jgi:diaminohydroxyphosphoribosylaminopyrimidine deaminase/5-amino-6-(5-phosphoribosylamino)uracil reductase
MVTLLCTPSAPKDRMMALEKAGATVTTLLADADGQLDLHAVLNHLGTIGINTILVEAGTGVTTAMLAAGLVDKIYWTQSQHILGADARPVVGPLKLVALPPQNLYTQITSSSIGQDQLRVFVQDVNQDKTG